MIRDVITAITWDFGYHITMEQHHVLLPRDGVPDWRRVDLVFLGLGSGLLGMWLLQILQEGVMLWS